MPWLIPPFSVSIRILLRGNHLHCSASLLSGGSVVALSNVSVLSVGVSLSSRINPIGMSSNSQFISTSTSSTSPSDIASSFQGVYCLVADPHFEPLLFVREKATVSYVKILMSYLEIQCISPFLIIRK